MRILVFGDSIVHGYFDEEFGGWANRLAVFTIQKQVASDFEYDKSIVSLGISGGSTDTLLERIGPELKVRLELQGNGAVLLAIGVNDTQQDVISGEYRVSITEYRENLTKIIEEIRPYTNQIVVIGIPPLDESMLAPIPWHTTHKLSTQAVVDYNAARKQISIEQELVYISLDEVFAGHDLPNVTVDGLHPNSEGHRLIFERVKGVLEAEGLL